MRTCHDERRERATKMLTLLGASRHAVVSIYRKQAEMPATSKDETFACADGVNSGYDTRSGLVARRITRDSLLIMSSMCLRLVEEGELPVVMQQSGPCRREWCFLPFCSRLRAAASSAATASSVAAAVSSEDSNTPPAALASLRALPNIHRSVACGESG